AFEIGLDIEIADAQHLEASALEPARALRVCAAAFVVEMMTAIHFDDQPGLVDEKVDDERADRNLAPKTEALGLWAQPEPRPKLGRLQIRPHRPCPPATERTDPTMPHRHVPSC